jgi:hypothetical protein
MLFHTFVCEVTYIQVSLFDRSPPFEWDERDSLCKTHLHTLAATHLGVQGVAEGIADQVPAQGE